MAEKNGKIHLTWAGITAVLMLSSGLVGWGFAWKTMDAKAETAIGNSYRNEIDIRSHNARMSILEGSYNTISAEIAQFNKEMNQLREDNRREHEEIKGLLRTKNISMKIEPNKNNSIN